MTIYIFSLASINTFNMPEIWRLPTFLHQVLQAVHNLSSNEAASATLRDHLPYMPLEFAALYTGSKAVLSTFFNRRIRRIKEAQARLKEGLKAGEQALDMSGGFSLIFAGKGDPLARLVAEELPDETVQVVSSPDAIKDPRLPHVIEGREKELVPFDKAGEILFLPTADEHPFLCPPDQYDMGLANIVEAIRQLDSYCNEREDCEKKKFVIVGDDDLKMVKVSSVEGEEPELEEITLSMAVEKLKKEGINVVVVDPDRAVMDEILKRIGGRRVKFVATRESYELYEKAFFGELNEARGGDSVNESEPPISVFYNITDVPTVSLSEGGEAVYLVTTPEAREQLKSRGVSENNVLLIPEIIRKAIERELED